MTIRRVLSGYAHRAGFVQGRRPGRRRGLCRGPWAAPLTGRQRGGCGARLTLVCQPSPAGFCSSLTMSDSTSPSPSADDARRRPKTPTTTTAPRHDVALQSSLPAPAPPPGLSPAPLAVVCQSAGRRRRLPQSPVSLSAAEVCPPAPQRWRCRRQRREAALSDISV